MAAEILHVPSFFHAVIRGVAQDHMVQEGDAQQLAGIIDPFRGLDILHGRGDAPGRVIMRGDDG